MAYQKVLERRIKRIMFTTLCKVKIIFCNDTDNYKTAANCCLIQKPCCKLLFDTKINHK